MNTHHQDKIMPTRYLKPGVRDSEAIDRLSPLAEVLFYRLLVTVDDYGRFDARPAMVKANCFPIKETVRADDCIELLQELVTADLVTLYEVDGKPILQMLKWDNAPRSKESKYPSPSGAVAIQVHTPADVVRTPAKTKAKAEAPAFSLPDWVPQSAWLDYVEMRKKIKKPMTPRAMELAMQKLAELMRAGHDPARVLNQSTLNSWQGLFELKGSTGNRGGANETPYQRQMRQRVAEATGGLLTKREEREVIDVDQQTTPITRIMG